MCLVNDRSRDSTLLQFEQRRVVFRGSWPSRRTGEADGGSLATSIGGWSVSLRPPCRPRSGVTHLSKPQVIAPYRRQRREPGATNSRHRSAHS